MDNPRAIPESHPLHRLFRGLTEYAFMNELGIGDPSLVGYVAELLASFVPSQGVWQLRDAQGRPLFQVTAMVAEAEAADDAARRRECHRHVGDFTLFWTGVYPEALAKLQGGDSADALISYQQQGKRSYHLASVLSAGNDRETVFRRLSDQFELCAVGLSRVRREWEKIELDGPPPGGGSPSRGRLDARSLPGLHFSRAALNLVGSERRRSCAPAAGSPIGRPSGRSIAARPDRAAIA